MNNKTFFNLITIDDLDKKYYLSFQNKVKSILLKSVYAYYKELLEKNQLINKVKNNTIFNSTSQSFLYTALLENKIVYRNGLFTGSFNGRIREELKQLKATYNKSANAYYLANIPKDIQELIKDKESKRQNVVLAIVSSFPAIQDFVQKKLEKVDYEQSYKDLHSELLKKMNYNVDSTFTTDSSPFIEKYTNSTKLNIKGFADEEMIKLRDNIVNTIKSGGRQQEIKDILNKNYNLNINRVERIAKQEFNLATKFYQYDFMESTGNDLFYWVHIHRNDKTARPEHVAFAEASDNGKLYSYKNLPINPKTNKPDAPGILPNCHCLARFVVAKR